jgi:hypothetical protein
VAVPDLRGIDAVPGGAHQLVIGETARQARVARIPEALLRPVAPRRARGQGAEAKCR